MPERDSAKLAEFSRYTDESVEDIIQYAAELLPLSDRMVMITMTVAILAARVLSAHEVLRGEDAAAAYWAGAIEAAKKGMRQFDPAIVAEAEAMRASKAEN